MSSYSRIRLTVFETVLFLLVVVIGWAALRAFRMARQIDHIPATFQQMPEAYFRIADRLEPTVNNLNELLARFAARHERADWDRFLRESQELKKWLNEEKASSLKTKVTMLQPVQVTMDIGGLLEQVSAAYEVYLLEARKATHDGTRTGETNLLPTNLDKPRQQSRQLLALANQARAQGQAIQIFISGSKSWFPWLQQVVVGGLLILVAIGLWFAIIVYRRVVSPLRQKLLESDTIIERQQKLAHFGELAAGVAHEIRNPLTAIRARLFTLQRTLDTGTPAHDDTVVIRNEIERLNRIVTDFLQLARPAEPRVVPIAAEPLLCEVRQLFVPQCDKQRIELKVETANGTRLLADPQQMKQVLINLIQNAADSIEMNGTITLRARPDKRLLARNSAESVIIEVEDTGPGIPPAVQRRLFDPFFSTKEGGSGLGLSIAAQIVTNHGGKLEFQTQPSTGTTFSIVLPAPNQPA
jgi:signal transduction histidine kinase